VIALCEVLGRFLKQQLLPVGQQQGLAPCCLSRPGRIRVDTAAACLRCGAVLCVLFALATIHNRHT